MDGYCDVGGWVLSLILRSAAAADRSVASWIDYNPRAACGQVGIGISLHSRSIRSAVHAGRMRSMLNERAASVGDVKNRQPA
jgi:hypothetical protein